MNNLNLPELDINDSLLPMNLAKKYSEFIYEKSYWEVGTSRFANKIDAIIDSETTGSPLEFCVDPLWKTINFGKPPSADLFTVFKERAAQIRRDYDYIRLLMGAGWDTHTVLQSFYAAGAKLNEIVINRKYIKSPNDLCCFEETHVIPKTLDYYRDFLKDTKITIIDTDWKIFDKFYSDINFMRYHFSTQIEFHSGITGYNPYWFEPKFLEKFDDGVRAVNIMGTEKPRIHKALDRFWYMLIDRDFKVSAPGHLDFFRDVHFPELAVAETHELLKHVENKIPLYESIKSVRYPIPPDSYNDMVHKLPSKYFAARAMQENNKGVAMAMEASLHAETKHLHQKWIDNIQYWVDLFPTWFPENWIPGKWINGSSSWCFSLDNGEIYHYKTLKSMHNRLFPDTPMSMHMVQRPNM